MTIVRLDHHSRPRLWKTINATTAVALALFALSCLASVDIVLNPSQYGYFGLTVHPPNSSVSGGTTIGSVIPGSPAFLAGIKPGDSLQPPRALRDRLLLLNALAVRAGEQMTITITRKGENRMVLLRASPAPPNFDLYSFSSIPVSKGDRVAAVLQVGEILVFLAVGLTLVLIRPSVMMWGFYLFATTIALFNWTSTYILDVPPNVYVVLVGISSFVIAGGAAGFLVFCLRFPTDTATGWRKPIDAAAPYLAAFLLVLLVAGDVTGFTFAPSATVGLINQVSDATSSIVYASGTLVLLISYFSAGGAERYRIKWVVLGLVCTSIALGFWELDAHDLISPPDWLNNAFSLLYVLLPLAVGYAVIRHRVIDTRFVLSRSLVIGVMAAVVILVIVSVDWLFSTKLPSSRFEAAVYAGIALLVGFSLNAARQWIGKTIDALFFRQWHRTQEHAEAVAQAARRAASPADLHEPMTAGIGHALSLASAALFEHAEDGGFIRLAASGWPPGTLWHILPEHPLVRRACERARVVDIDNVKWNEGDVPAGAARPTVMVPIVTGKQVLAILLYGAHENGVGLDPDELRIIRELAADSGMIFRMVSDDVSSRTYGLPQAAST